MCALLTVPVQVVETAITPQLAFSARGRGAETEPFPYGEPRHTRREDTPRRCAAVGATSPPPSACVRQTGSRPHSVCHRCPCASAPRDGSPALPHCWSVRPRQSAPTSSMPGAASRCLDTSRRSWAPHRACPLPISVRLRGVVASCRHEPSRVVRSLRARGATTSTSGAPA